MHEALFVVDKMTIKDRTYVEILTVIWGLYNTAAWKGLKFKQGKSIPDPNRTLCISTSLKIRRKSSHCRSSVKHCLCFTKKTGKLEVESTIIYQVTFFWAPLQLEIWSIQHAKQQLGDVWCHMLLLVMWFLLLFQSRVFPMLMKKLHLARLNYSRRRG